MTSSETMPFKELTPDAELVTACLGGDREAFAQIVERYQRLLCSLAYSSTGRLSESEDLAQEAFVTAWTQLGKLREPDRLRSWLCGILRHTVSRSRRRAGREPIDQAASLEVAVELTSDETPAAEHAMNEEEQRLLWHALEQVPETYREPLVLYYRQHRSVEHVAYELDLTEDAVKQRLSRGRKMLQERFLSFVEGALERSTPGPVFAAGVVAAIATLAPPAKAAVAGTAGAVATKVGTTIKFVTLAAFFASISGLISTVLGIRVGLDQSRTAKERRATVRVAISLAGSCLVFVALLYGLRAAALSWPTHLTGLTVLVQFLVVAFAIGWPMYLLRQFRWSRELRSSERLSHPEAFRDPRDHQGSTAGQYRSKASFLGIPLVHIQFSGAEVDSRPVVAWIAGGERAIGLLLAWGGWSVGFISVGACSIGVISLGAVSFGILSLGSVAVGLLSVGSAAIGYEAFGGVSATAWNGAAGGGFALAHHFAAAPIAIARFANDPVAGEHFASPHANLYSLIFFVSVTLMTLIPITLYARAVRRRFGKRAV